LWQAASPTPSNAKSNTGGQNEYESEMEPTPAKDMGSIDEFNERDKKVT
jgi:hypothetical protein